jgi:hypothetical protein
MAASSWERLLGDEPKIRKKVPPSTDKCQCCGVTAAQIQERDTHWSDDPMYLTTDVKLLDHDLGTLCLCGFCSWGLRDHFVNKFTEEHHQPLQERFDKIRELVKNPIFDPYQAQELVEKIRELVMDQP